MHSTVEWLVAAAVAAAIAAVAAVAAVAPKSVLWDSM